MTRFTRLFLIVLAAALLTPAIGFAQEGGASIAGTIKDASGAVLPGVTVEASSPALIEKVRTTVSDARGRYLIVGLRPGDYTVTFSLPGFSTYKRENIVLAGEFAATIDADMKVGAVEETITVNAESPIVDIVNAKQERVMSADVIEDLPSSRVHSSLAQLIPGIQTANQDVGGTVVAAGLLSGHGTKGPDSRIMVNGLSQGSQRNSGGGVTTPNMGAMEQATINYAGVGADSETGGIQVNLIPRDGGNQLRVSSYFLYANPSWQADNLTSTLESRGLGDVNKIRDNWDINPGFGGPIKKDKLWFYFSSRNITTNNYVGGMYVNRNAGNPNAFSFDPDLSKQAVEKHNWKDNQGRVTWQVTQRNKLAFTIEEMRQCECNSGVSDTVAPEAASSSKDGQEHQYFVDYQLPLTNKILIEAYIFTRTDHWKTGNDDGTQPPFITPDQYSTNARYLSLPPYINRITIQAGELAGLSYRAQSTFNDSKHVGFYHRANVSYVTGTHNIKVGYSSEPGWLTRGTDARNPLFYRFSRSIEEGGVPNQMTLNATPYYPKLSSAMSGIYAQDKWSSGRMTVGLGIRYDMYRGGWPDMTIGPAALAPNRNLNFSSGVSNSWNDVTPKLSFTYDLFGNGKTALKTTLNKYMAAASTTGLNGTINPISTLINSTTRNWTDSNKNYIPDCDILNPAAQNLTATGGDICAAMSNPDFGTTRVGTTVDPNLAQGWGVRDYSWEGSVGVSHELAQGLAMDVAYFRRWYGNFTVTDDLARTAADFDQFSIVAPTATPFASTAPEGATIPLAGQTISGLYNVKPASFSLVSNNYITLASNYGKQIEHWNGVDVSFNARMPFGLRLQGGTNTGKTLTDNCEIRAKLPEISPTNPWCHVDTGWLTHVSGFASYTIPKVDVLTAVTFQNRPSREDPIQANYTATNADTQPSLGRPLSGGAANVTVPLVNPYSVQGSRFTQVDLRFGKVLSAGKTRTTVNFDLYNALNSSSLIASNTAWDQWQRPSEILLARFLKIGLQFNF